MSFTVTLVRHGQTDFNLKNLVHSSSNGTINETGRKEAEILGKFLADEKYTQVYSSDLQRCQDTCKIVRENLKHPSPEPILDKRLREQDFAEWDGRPSRELWEMAIKEKKDPFTMSAPGGETYAEAQARFVQFFKELFEARDVTDKEENVIIFSHGLSIMYLLVHFSTNRDLYETENFTFSRTLHSGNTARTKFIVGKSNSGKRKLEFVCQHDRSHISAL